jgi:hypothetical protein
MLAEWTGLEPATPGVTGRYSNQLNYHSAVLLLNVIIKDVTPFIVRSFKPYSLLKQCWRSGRDSNPRPPA